MSGAWTGEEEYREKVKNLWIYSFCLAVLFSLGCASSNRPALDLSYRQRAHQFTARHGAQEASKDFAQAEYGIYSAKAYTLYYPGLDTEVGEVVANKFGVRHIEGTSDAIKNSDHRDFILAAFYFASEYNRKKLELLKNSEKLKP